jgi:hypothetical protein
VKEGVKQAFLLSSLIWEGSGWGLGTYLNQKNFRVRVKPLGITRKIK